MTITMQVDVYKDPVDDHSKVSKKGRLTLELDDNGQYVTKTEGNGDPTKVFHIQCHSQTLPSITHTHWKLLREVDFFSHSLSGGYKNMFGRMIISQTFIHPPIHVLTNTDTCHFLMKSIKKKETKKFT